MLILMLKHWKEPNLWLNLKQWKRLDWQWEEKGVAVSVEMEVVNGTEVSVEV